ncbi:MAG: efflux RND transporter periplasmic adaptor subunit [Burkholderiales bacterium]
MIRAVCAALCAALFVAGCRQESSGAKSAAPPPTPITVADAQLRNVAVLEHAIGEVQSTATPEVSAEVVGRIVQLFADVGDAVKIGQALAQLDSRDLEIARRAASAEVKRLEALVANQRRLADRYRELIKQNFISPITLDNTESQLTALLEELAGAQAQLANANRGLSKARIVSPVQGRVEQRMVSQGDYVQAGDALFQIATSQRLRVRLPLPESVASHVMPGLKVILSTPTAPDTTVEGRIKEIKPLIGTGNRALEAIVEVDNPGRWQPGASVNGAVVIAQRRDAVVVPEASVVLRPAGKVIYAIHDGIATQRVVTTGAQQDGYIEIVNGVAAGDEVAVDGAGFLTDKAAVKVQGKP